MPDAAEAAKAPLSASGVIEPRPPLLEPESVRTKAAPPRLPSQAPRPPHPSISGREGGESTAAPPKSFDNALAKPPNQRQAGTSAPLPPADPAQALAQLQRQREVGAPAPPPPPSKPALGNVPDTHRAGADSPRRLPSAAPVGFNHDAVSTPGALPTLQPRASSTEVPPPIPPVVPSTSNTSPVGPLNLKPGTTPLAPSRAPSPIAIVGGSSLKINSPDKPMAPSRPAPTTLLAAIEANAPKLPTDSFGPPLAPTAMSAPPSSAKGLGTSTPPGGALPSRPNTTPKAFAPPAGGPPGSYERAFRQWSSPNITTVEDPGGSNAEPVTFQVYTAKDISAGRAPMRSLPAVPPEAKKANLAARIGMVAVGVVIVLLTAAAVIAVSTDDPKPPAPRVTSTEEPPPPAMTSVVDPSPTSISIGDPVDDTIDEVTPAPAVTTAALPTATTPKPKPKPSVTTTGPAPPASLKGIAPPPNPYGK